MNYGVNIYENFTFFTSIFCPPFCTPPSVTPNCPIPTSKAKCTLSHFPSQKCPYLLPILN